MGPERGCLGLLSLYRLEVGTTPCEATSVTESRQVGILARLATRPRPGSSSSVGDGGAGGSPTCPSRLNSGWACDCTPSPPSTSALCAPACCLESSLTCASRASGDGTGCTVGRALSGPGEYRCTGDATRRGPALAARTGVRTAACRSELVAVNGAALWGRWIVVRSAVHSDAKPGSWCAANMKAPMELTGSAATAALAARRCVDHSVATSREGVG